MLQRKLWSGRSCDLAPRPISIWILTSLPPHSEAAYWQWEQSGTWMIGNLSPSTVCSKVMMPLTKKSVLMTLALSSSVPPKDGTTYIIDRSNVECLLTVRIMSESYAYWTTQPCWTAFKLVHRLYFTNESGQNMRKDSYEEGNQGGAAQECEVMLEAKNDTLPPWWNVQNCVEHCSNMSSFGTSAFSHQKYLWELGDENQPSESQNSPPCLHLCSICGVSESSTQLQVYMIRAMVQRSISCVACAPWLPDMHG